MRRTFRSFRRAPTPLRINSPYFRLIERVAAFLPSPFFILPVEGEENQSQSCAANSGNSHRPISRILSDRPAGCHDRVDEIIIYLGPPLPPGSSGLPAR